MRNKSKSSALVLLTLLSLVLRGVVPAGFMPAPVGETAALKLCPGKFSHHALNTLLPAVEHVTQTGQPLQNETHANFLQCEITGYSLSDTIQTGAPSLLNPCQGAKLEITAALQLPYAPRPAIKRARAPPQHFVIT